MELRHLLYFVAVAEERNFTRAGQRLHIVQSAVSSAIKVLEREVGAVLLDRNSKQVHLTEAGLALLPEARATLDAAQQAQDAVDAVRGGIRGTLHIGSITSVGLIDLPALLGAYHRRYPEVTLQVTGTPSGSRGLLQEVAEHKLDLAFVSVIGERTAGIDVRELAATVLDVIVPAEHPLAERKQVRLHELADDVFIDFPQGFGNRAVTDRAFQSAGLQRRVGLEITNTATAADFVRHGLGIAMLPRFTVPRRKDLGRLTVIGADLRWSMMVATSSVRRPTAAARALLALLGTATGSSPTVEGTHHTD